MESREAKIINNMFLKIILFKIKQWYENAKREKADKDLQEMLKQAFLKPNYMLFTLPGETASKTASQVREEIRAKAKNKREKSK